MALADLLHPDERRLTASTLAAGIRPLPPLPLSQWLAKNLVLVDGPQAGQLWDAAGAPYLPEIADCLGDDDPCNLVTIRKSQQSGASILALGWCLYIADREPANTLYAVPGIDALRDLNGQKLQPLIDAWQRHRRRTVIEPQTSRSGTGSTTYEKKFAGGYLSLANANAVMDLSSKTVKKGVKDEVSKWGDIPGFGDPESLFFGRFTAFRRHKTYKILEISTPEIDTGDEAGEMPGHCRIDRSFKASDQRFWQVPCPECGGLFVHEFAAFRVDEAHPHRSHYPCPHCGHAIGEAERVQAVRAGLWVPARPAVTDHPGFHIDAFVSLMMSYEAIAEDWLKQRKSEKGRKDFHNLVLGLPYKFRGDAPDHVRLMERREDHLRRGHVPARGLILTAAADVQLRGIWVEILAHAENRETWVVDAFYIDGDTASHEGPAFRQLREQVLDREFPDAFGRMRKVDALAVDSGFNTHTVYSFVRAAQRPHPFTGHDVVYAIKGLEGWGRPPIGLPQLVDINLGGRKVRQGCKVWAIGTWSLKGSFYADLGRLGVRSGAETDPDGYCHFGAWMDEIYFRQITAESLEDIIVRGRTTGRKWVRHAENHFLDCRVYNLAIAEHLGLVRMTSDEWAVLARRHGPPMGADPQDLFTGKAASAAEPPSQPAAPAQPQRGGFLGRRPGFLGR